MNFIKKNIFKSLAFTFTLCLGFTTVSNANAGQLSFTYENDAMSFDDKDRYYTNGVEVSYLVNTFEVSFAHQIFTPSGNSNIPLNIDRPDVSYTSLGIAIHTIERPYDFVQIGTGEVTLGFMGFTALSREMQKIAHDVFNDSKVFRYGEQIDNEVTAMLTLAYGLSLNKDILSEDPKLFNWDVQPRTHLSLGTPYTSVGAGAEVRLGMNLPISTYTPTIKPANGIRVASPYDDPNQLSFYVFGGVDGYANLWNSFLDGNLFGADLDVDKRIFVGEVSAGLDLSFKDLTVTYAHFMRSKEFDAQEEAHTRGSLSVSYVF